MSSGQSKQRAGLAPGRGRATVGAGSAKRASAAVQVLLRMPAGVIAWSRNFLPSLRPR
jgi:hypothetical protein